MIKHLKVSIILACIGLLSSCGYVWAHGACELNYVNKLRIRGNYVEARRHYFKISVNYDLPVKIFREASYWQGFCSVRLNEYSRAIEEYERFLRNFGRQNKFNLYDASDQSFIPDALYSLGRCYELVEDYEKARGTYRECMKRFPESGCGIKSEKRLRQMLALDWKPGMIPPDMEHEIHIKSLSENQADPFQEPPDSSAKEQQNVFESLHSLSNMR